MTQRQTRCIDCKALGRITSRPALNPGPRCDEHKHARKRAVAKRVHGTRMEKAFNISRSVYDAIYEWQKNFISTQVNWKGEKLRGVCYGCGKATGKTKALAVDHDHRCAELNGTDHPPEVGCPKCIRALLCGQCNTILGRYDAGALRRLVEVLEDPPAQRIIGAIMEDANGVDLMSEDS
jgi:Recombination endonuclease VII